MDNEYLAASRLPHPLFCVPYLSRYEVSRSLWRAWEGKLLPGDHHHLGARACLVDMSWRHRPRAGGRWDTPRPTVGRQAGPVGIIGLKQRQGGRHRRKMREEHGDG